MEIKKDYAIGVFDSGMGGLTSVKALNRILPNENIVFFGDTARVPYGNKSHDTIMKYALQDVAFLKKHNIKMVIAACGTVSSAVGEGTLCDDMPYTGVVIPAAMKAAKITKNGKIGVISTSATLRTGAFARLIRRFNTDAEVTSSACPLFVSLVENGFIERDNKVTRLVAEQYLADVKKAGVDTLILGCTHFPIIRDIIGDIMGDGVTLIDTGEQAARYAKKILSETNMLTDKAEKGTNTFYVSDSTELFEENAKIFLGGDTNGNVYQEVVS